MLLSDDRQNFVLEDAQNLVSLLQHFGFGDALYNSCKHNVLLSYIAVNGLG